MEHTVARTTAFAAILLGLTVAASAQEGQACSNASIRGAWGYTETGTVIAITSPSPTPITAAAVGRYDFDDAGGFTGVQKSSAGGAVSSDTKLGTYVVNEDCTGTLTLGVYNQAGTLVRSSVWSVVITGHGSEMRGIMLSMTGAPVPIAPIMTFSATKLFPGRGNQQ